VDNTKILRPLEIQHPILIRTYDIDFGGIVSNIVYVRWLEDLRLMMLEAYMPLDQQMAMGNAPVLAETLIKYKRPLRLFDKPMGCMWAAGMSGTRWTLDAEFTLDGAVTTTASQQVVFVDTQTFRPVAPAQTFVDRYLADKDRYDRAVAGTGA
jgi:acyl-CoA thioester hydrolase